MPHISKKRLNQEVFKKLMVQFSQTLEEADNRSKSNQILNELFTKTEKIMFAKRIMTIYLLHRNIPFQKISEIIQISPTTIAKYSLALEQGKYDETLIVITRKGKLLESLEKLMQVGLPPRGKGRWKNI